MLRRSSTITFERIQHLQNDITIVLGDLQGYMQMVYGLPDKAVIDYYMPSVYLWDSPFFGEHFTRKVIPLMSLDAVRDPDQLQALGIEYVYIDLTSNPNLEDFDPRLHEYARQDHQWVVYKFELP